MKKNWIIAIFICICSIHLAQAKNKYEFNSTKSIENWMSNYYHHPQAAKFIDALKAASKLGFLAEEFRWSEITGFSAGVINTNPKLALPLEQLIEQIKPNERQALILGLLYANKTESRIALKKLSEKIPAYKTGLMRSLSMRETDLYKMLPLAGNPTAIDAYWGYFMANGSDVPVNKVIETLQVFELKENDKKNTQSNRLLANVAIASLRSHIKTSARVRKICKQQIKKQPQNVAKILHDILNN